MDSTHLCLTLPFMSGFMNC